MGIWTLGRGPSFYHTFPSKHTLRYPLSSFLSMHLVIDVHRGGEESVLSSVWCVAGGEGNADGRVDGSARSILLLAGEAGLRLLERRGRRDADGAISEGPWGSGTGRAASGSGERGSESPLFAKSPAAP